MKNNQRPVIRSTTVIGVIRDGKAALGSDGQMTLGNTVIKHSTRKIRRLYHGKLVAGFAGATADAVTLLDRFEEKLEAYNGKLDRAAVELARDWRTDKYLRRLEAMLAIVSGDKALIISGTGDVIEPEDGIVAIGSGSNGIVDEIGVPLGGGASHNPWTFDAETVVLFRALARRKP